MVELIQLFAYIPEISALLVCCNKLVISYHLDFQVYFTKI